MTTADANTPKEVHRAGFLNSDSRLFAQNYRCCLKTSCVSYAEYNEQAEYNKIN